MSNSKTRPTHTTPRGSEENWENLLSDPNSLRSKIITDKDSQSISELLLHILIAAPRTLTSVGQCFAIAWSDGVDNIAQEKDDTMYARIGHLASSASLSCHFADNILSSDPSFSGRTLSNVLISGEQHSGKRKTGWAEYR
jgi:hypothetical protein